MHTSTTWCDISGATETQLISLVHRPTIVCSNSFVLKTPSTLLFVDPGKGDKQLRRIRGVVESLESDGEKETKVALTHCHVDHYLNAADILGTGSGSRELICHREAAEALRHKDLKLTIAEMHSISELPTCNPDHPMFASDADYRVEHLGDNRLLVQEFKVDRFLTLKAYHTPGHSPDGTCFQVGDCLFVGDLPFAANLAVAGMTGWNDEDLICSFENILRIGEHGGISSVFTGHGYVLTWEEAAALLESSRRKALRLSDIVPFDNRRVDDLMEYPVILLDESQAVLSTITSILTTVSDNLRTIDGEQAAAELLEKLDIEAIQDDLVTFQHFVDDFRQHVTGPKKILLLKTAQFIGKIEKAMSFEQLAPFVHPFLLRTLESLFSDFVNSVYGVHFHHPAPLDVEQAIRNLLRTMRAAPYNPDAIFDSIDDKGHFETELCTRTAFSPGLFEAINVDLVDSGPSSAASIHKDAFEDIVLAMFLYLVLQGIHKIVIVVAEHDNTVVVRISPKDTATTNLSRNRRMYAEYLLRLHGGRFSQEKETTSLVFPRARRE